MVPQGLVACYARQLAPAASCRLPAKLRSEAALRNAASCNPAAQTAKPRSVLPQLGQGTGPRGSAGLLPRACACLVGSPLVTALGRARRRAGAATQRQASSMGGEFDTSAYYEAPRDSTTAGWVMQQTMFRIKEPKRSLDFYTKVLGMQLITSAEFPQWGFTVYFVGYPPEKDLGPIPEDDAEKFAYCMMVPGCVELTWNHGSEELEAPRVYNTGNSDTTGTADGSAAKGGFGHIGITVPDVYLACQRFHSMGAVIHKSPNSGGMKGLAFIKDPDGYLIEVLPLGKAFPFPTQEVDCCGVSLAEGGGYKDNSAKA